MGEPDLNAINRRLQRLEKENLLLRKVGAVLLLFLLAATLTGASYQSTSEGQRDFVSKEVKARRFVLVDAEGRERAMLLADAQGTQLVLSSARGNNLVRLASFDALGPSLLFYDSHGKLRLRAAMDRNGPHLDMLDAREKPVVSLYSLRDVSSLTLWSQNQENTAVLQTFDRGSYLELEDSKKFKSTLGTAKVESIHTGETHETSAASLVMLDKDGTVVWQAP